MSREDADKLVSDYDEARSEWRLLDRYGDSMAHGAWVRMNDIRERLIGLLSGKEES